MASAWALTACASAPAAEPARAPDPDPPAAPSTMSTTIEPDARVEEVLLTGLEAAGRSDFATAAPTLAWVVEACPGEAAGTHALLALLGVLVDPRNPQRDLEGARRIAAAYLASPSRAAWAEPAVEALYLAALELGGTAPAPPEVREVEIAPGSPPERGLEPPTGTVPGSEAAGSASPRGCDARGAKLGERSAPRLPALPGRPLRDSLRDAETERAELRETVERLELRVAELQAELDRIRKALEP